jgi:methylated-DNA-[protein]-cysteine S-methyltransferase
VDVVHVVVDSPLGPVVVAGSDDGVTNLRLPAADGSAAVHGVGGRVALGDVAVLDLAAGQIEEYFAGRRRTFDVPLRLVGTAFQRRVWEGLRAIPYGTTTTYGALALELGLDPRTTSRAVGAANGANHVAVMVPCHRVVGANGSLVGFAAGVERKRELLDLERRVSGGAAVLF